jgi:hypothetical protein
VAVEVHQASATSSDLVFDLGVRVVSEPELVKSAASPVVTPSDDEWGPGQWRSAGVYAPSVVRVDDGSWVMYFSGTNGGGPHEVIGRATSTDGVSWSVDDAPTNGGAILQSAVYDGAQYYLYSTIYGAPGLRLATSTDGVTFAWPGVEPPVIEDVYAAAVILDAGVFRAWYLVPSGSFYATSVDGRAWTVVGAIVGPRPETVVHDASGYHGWYQDGWRDFGYATSSDGLTWTKHGVSLTTGAPGTWDESSISGPAAIQDGDSLRLYYAGGSYPREDGMRIGFAQAQSGFTGTHSSQRKSSVFPSQASPR